MEFQWNFNQTTTIRILYTDAFMEINLEMSFEKYRPLCLDLYLLTSWAPVQYVSLGLYVHRMTVTGSTV